MKRLAVLSIAALLLFPGGAVAKSRGGSHSSHSSSSSSGKVHVKGYTRKDGTYVPPHYRAAPHSREHGAGSSGSSSSAAPHVSSPSSSGACATCARDEHGRILRSEQARNQFMRQTGYPDGRPGHVVDHIIPLQCGGADTPANMQWQTEAEARAKDRTESACRR